MMSKGKVTQGEGTDKGVNGLDAVLKKAIVIVVQKGAIVDLDVLREGVGIEDVVKADVNGVDVIRLGSIGLDVNGEDVGGLDVV